MIITPDNDPATRRWRELQGSASFFLHSLPQGHGTAYAMKHFLEVVNDLEQDASLSLHIRDLRPYFAALVYDAMYRIEGSLRASQPNFSYVEGAYYGYHYLHVLLRYYHEEQFQNLPHVWRYITQAHIEGQGLYREVLGYIRADIEKMRHPTVNELRLDTLIYLDRMRRSALKDKEKQQAVHACCTVLHSFH